MTRASVEPRGSGREFRPDIEGLRAVAVVLVVAFHVGIDRIFVRYSLDMMGGGFIGVDVFYVISGFLITGLLIREVESTGRLSLRAFYGRRIRRLLPAATVVLLVTVFAAFTLLPPIDLVRVTKDALSAALYGSNIWYGAQATEYLGAGHTESPLLHYWSLSLEEQFYLLWPALLLGCVAVSRRWSRHLSFRGAVAIATAVIVAASFAASVIVTPISAPWAYFGLPTRAWELGVGAGLALVAPRLRRWPRWLGHLLGLTGLSLVLGSFTLLDQSALFPGSVAAFPVLGTAMIIAGGSVGVRGGLVWLLSLPPLMYLGRISYSWYLWHWPFITLAGPATGATGRPVAAVVLAAAGLSLVAAAITHAVVEQPLRRTPRLTGSGRPFVLAGASVIAVASLSGPLLMWASADAGTGATTAGGARLDRARDTDHCAQDFPDTDATPCESGDFDADVVVAMVGDSHAAHMLPALDAAAEDRGWRVLLYTKAACPPIDVRQELENYKREYTECSQWRADVWDQLEVIQPEYVLLSRYGGYSNLLGDGGTADSDDETAELWNSGAESMLRRLTPFVEHVVFLRDVPNPGTDVPACISAADGDVGECAYPSAGHVRIDEHLHTAELDAAAGLEGVHFVDLSDYICDSEPCSVVDDHGVIKYRDSNHLTATYSATLGQALGRALDRLADVRATRASR